MMAPALRFDWRDFAARNVIFLVLLAIVAANAALTPNFATPRNVEITLIQIVFVALVGTGMTLVMALGGIDLSVGAVMGLVSVAVVHLLPYGLGVVLPACLLIGLVIGLWNGLIVTVFAVRASVLRNATHASVASRPAGPASARRSVTTGLPVRIGTNRTVLVSVNWARAGSAFAISARANANRTKERTRSSFA